MHRHADTHAHTETHTHMLISRLLFKVPAPALLKPLRGFTSSSFSIPALLIVPGALIAKIKIPVPGKTGFLCFHFHNSPHLNLPSGQGGPRAGVSPTL